MARVERRSCPRHKPPAAAAVLAVRPDYNLMGSIRDICKDGLQFQYLAEPEAPPFHKPGSKVEVDIFLPGESFYILGVPCSVIHDQQDAKATVSGRKILRYCGLKFGTLNEEHKHLLGLLVERSSRIHAPDAPSSEE
ncbi:MAG: PilZ domain-containing protein [Deltaproteobacteria bacterium]|nr:PilZ domain-containing protein [Deltaproteobacteria bacterium]